MDYYAHTFGENEEDWESLKDHLHKVAKLLAEFADVFDSRDWGYLLGLWHDLGKYHPRFQERLRDDTIRQPHAGAGAVHLSKRISGLWSYLALVIAGHHAGLANPTSSERVAQKPLRERLREAEKQEYPQSIEAAPKEILEHPIPSEAPAWITQAPIEQQVFRAEFWLRFLFSALVDADRLATEAFCDPDKAALRAQAYNSLPDLCQRLESHMVAMESGLSAEKRALPINVARRAISQACLDRAAEESGLFSLTVPTGGGKTLAAMRFALNHAAQRELRRVIVVIPYTSIIEQNAKRYAEVFGARNVVEHHSNLDPKKKREQVGDDVLLQHEMAAENWDAPIVVTTTVQFFESLFSNETSRCRKLHNIARSVVILDEVQSLPPEFLMTILDGLQQLASHYGCSIVLSTATPPALKKRASLPYGLENVREIVDDPAGLAVSLRRVRYEWPDVDGEKANWLDLALELAGNNQVLAVVHQRKDARELAEEMEKHVDPATLHHLSALMCPAHRLKVLDEVHKALAQGLPCRLVSTQLIEAGVDVDFPVVYRAMAGLDSVVQAAGRCNREGRLDQGRVVVFRAPTPPPSGTPRKGKEAAEVMLRATPDLDADAPDVQEEYFRRLYGVALQDTKNIQRERASFNFAAVGRDFHLIEDGFTYPVVIPWEDGAKRLEDLRRALKYGEHAGRDLFRALQPYTVSVYEKSFRAALNAGALEEVHEGLEMYALRLTHLRHYHEKYGLVIGDDIALGDSSAMIH